MYGAVAREQAVEFAPADFRTRRVDCRIDVPLDGLSPGLYLLEMTAAAGQRTAVRKVPIAVR